MARGKGKRGGHRIPNDPAPVSAPQSGARTDGGPGSSRTPHKFQPAGGEPYGRGQQLDALASAAPVAGDATTGVARPSATARPDRSSRAAPSPLSPDGIFGPTQEPNVPIGSDVVAPDPQLLDADTVLALLYQAYPSPWLTRLRRDGSIRSV